MKPQLLNRTSKQRKPFSVKKNSYPNFLKLWHYHPELELVVIIDSIGTRFVGDSIEKFQPGEIILIGKNLPHMWLNDEDYFIPTTNLKAEAYCIHFQEDFMGEHFLNLPISSHLLELFKLANRGIRFNNLDFPVIEHVQQLFLEQDEFEQLLLLLKLMDLLANHKDKVLLSSEGYFNSNIKDGSDAIHEYIFQNFKKPIQLADVAAVAEMNPTAFSRYFKRIHRKTFSQYLIEIRIGYACKLLIENKLNISDICYKSGFNNLSNFNKQFKKIMKMNPSDYIRKHH